MCLENTAVLLEVKILGRNINQSINQSEMRSSNTKNIVRVSLQERRNVNHVAQKYIFTLL